MSTLKFLANKLQNLVLRRPLLIYPVFDKRILSTIMEPAPASNKDQPKSTVSKEEILVSNKNSTRYKRKRTWDDTPPAPTDDSVPKQPRDRTKRKKMAVILGYCGTGYHGMQRNPGVNTIEEELCKALLETNYITNASFGMIQKAQFQRAARTDKGVSAARQVVSVKMPVEAKTEELNKHLPETIRVFGIKRVTKTFNSKSKCNARTYSYVLPTYAFEPKVTTVEERKAYRITDGKKEEVNSVLAEYVGTKNFYNFTEKKNFKDPSVQRFMTSFQVERVFVDGGLEFAVLQVKGQSFMLHQIRKMVGLALAVIRGKTDLKIFERAYSEEKTILPTAPSLNLMLDTVHYDNYNERYNNDGVHDSLNFQDINELVETFKKHHIFPSIIKPEAEEMVFCDFIDDKLPRHNFDVTDTTENVQDDVNNDSDSDNDKDDNDDKEK